jgi:hypothetical protein
MRKILLAATLMLLCIMNVCAQNDASASIPVSSQNLKGIWNAGKEFQAQLANYVANENMDVKFMLSFGDKSELTIAVPIKVTTQGMTLSVSFRIPGTYSLSGQDVKAQFDKEKILCEVTDIEGDNPDIQAMTKDEASRKMLITMLNNMIKNELKDEFEDITPLSDVFGNFTVKSLTATQMVLIQGDEKQEVSFDRYETR